MRVVLTFVLPIAALVMVTGVPTVVLTALDRFDFSDSAEARQRRKQARLRIVRLAVFAVFLMYPSVSSTALSFFNCRSVDGVSYVLADLRLSCGDELWNRYLPLAIVALLVYPIGIPFGLFVVLYRYRRRLQDADVQCALGLAYEPYNADVWYFETGDMIEKLLITAFLSFLPSRAQCLVGMAVVAVWLVILLVTEPYVRRIDDRLAVLVQSHLLNIFLAGAVLQNTSELSDSASDTTASVVLFLAFGVMIVLALYHAIVYVRTFVRAHQRQLLKASPTAAAERRADYAIASLSKSSTSTPSPDRSALVP